MSQNKRSFISGALTGFAGFLSVPGVLTKHRLWHYMLAPALCSLVLSLAVIFGIYQFADGLSGWLDEKIVLPWDWLDRTVTVSVGILSFVALVIAFVFVHKHLALILLAPLLGRLAEQTVRKLKAGHEQTPMPMTQAIWRGVRINLRYVAREIVFTLLFLVLGAVVPLVGPLLASVSIYLIQARYAGFGLMDFPLEYHGFSVSESVAKVKTRRGLATGLGAGYLLLMLIPIVGWMFAPTFGTVAGAVRMLEDLEREKAGR